MKKETVIMTQTAVAGVSAYISNKLGILYPVLLLLTAMMILDYITGLAASKKEAIEEPNNPNKGWSSQKGKLGIFKKLGYMVAVAVAMSTDFLIFYAAEQIGISVPAGTFFGLLTAVWLILNELLSLIENAGRMGAPIPSFLKNVISTLKESVEQQGENQK